MTALVLALSLGVLVAYFIFLGRLANATKQRKPALFAVVGGPAPWDYLMLGLAPGDTFISKLESRKAELSDDAHILKLMRATRGAHIAILLMACVWLIVLVNDAN
jgi:hypothetical protein